MVAAQAGPRERAGRKPQQPLSDAALPMQTSQKHTGRFVGTVGDNTALCQFEIKRIVDLFLRDLQQLLGQRHPLIHRQAAMPFVHGLGPRRGNAGANHDHRGLLDAEFHRDRVGGLEADTANVTRQAIWVLRHDLHGIGAVGL